MGRIYWLMGDETRWPAWFRMNRAKASKAVDEVGRWGKVWRQCQLARGNIRRRRSAGPDGIVEGGKQVTNRAAGATQSALSGAAAVAVCNQRRQSEVEVAPPCPARPHLPPQEVGYSVRYLAASRRTECSSGTVQASDGTQSTEYK